MRIMTMAALLLLMAAPARSQNPGDLFIRVSAYESTATGGEKDEGMHHSIAMTFGKAFVARWSLWGCGMLELYAGDDKFADQAKVGWRVEITPLRVVDRAVTFRLRWVRALDEWREASFTPGAPPQEDVELTLRMGEERTIDRVRIPKGAQPTVDNRACQKDSASLRLFIESYPWEELDRRLVAADLWLVERVAGGGERSQPLSVRGLPNRPIPFYFDSIPDGADSLDIFGQIVPIVEKNGLSIALETRSRWVQSSRDSGRAWPTQWLKSEIHVKPQEIVEVALPKLGRNGGPFGERQFAIRIRARQVR